MIEGDEAAIAHWFMIIDLFGFINAVYANSFDSISIIPTFVLTPLIYLGNL